MKTKGIVTLLVVLWIATVAGGLPLELEQPQYAGVTAWVMGGSEFRELRVGYQQQWIEGLLAVNHRGAIEQKKAAEDLLGARAYVLVHAVDANMVATWFGAHTNLPEGSLYLGAYGGWEFADDQLESGMVIGGAIALNPRVDMTVEYQRAWTNLKGQDQEMVIGGLAIKLGKIK